MNPEDVAALFREAHAEIADPADVSRRLTKAKRGYGATDGSESHTAFQYPNPTTVIALQDQNAVDDPSPIKTTQLYDGLGRPTERDLYETPAQYIATQQTYDALGRTASRLNPSRPGDGLAYSTSFTYDALDRTTQITRQDSVADIATFAYSGNQTTSTDETSVSKTILSDALGRVTNVTQSGLATSYTYDVLNDLLQVTQSSQTRSFEYDSLKRLKNACNPESVPDGTNGTTAVSCATSPLTGNVIRYTYDANGNVLTKTDGRNIQISYGYDALNRLITTSYSDGTPATLRCYDGNVPNANRSACTTASPAIAYPLGKLTASANSLSTTEYLGFDALGRVKSSSQTPAGSGAFSFSYTYTLAGGMQSITYPSQRKISYGFDGAGRVSSVSGSGSDNFTSSNTPIAYAPHGGLTQINLGNGLIERTCYNQQLQTSNIRLATDSVSCPTANGTQPSWIQPDGNERMLLGFGYAAPNNGNNGNVWTQNILASDGVANGITLSLQQTYGYDGFNRLTTVSEAVLGGLPAGTTAQNWSALNQYDVYGNRWMQNPPSRSPLTPTGQAQFNGANNRLVARQSGAALPADAYDGAGNLHDHPDLGTLAHDAESRLTTFTAAGTSNTTTYSYDADGRRVGKADSGNSNTTATYVYDAMGQLGAEYSTAANPQTGIVYLTDDHLGSTRLITSGTAPATVVQRLDYFPFGENINLPDSTGNSNAVFANRNLVPSYNAGTVGPLQFTGKERDAETGLDFLEARYYSSAQGRFTSPDPVFLSDHRLADPQAWNLYSYVRNSPLTLTDRHGLDFYLDCKQSKNNASTCQGGHVGTTSTDANGKSTFTPTVVTSASLQDPNSGVTGTVTPGGVQIKTASGTYTGSFINGTPAATIQGSGILAPFTFTITGQQSGNTLEGRFRFNGTPEQAAQYLQSHGAWSYPLDAFNPFHPNSNQYRFSDPSNPSGPSIHIALPLESYLDPGPGYGIGLHTRPSSSEGDFHVDTHGTFWGHVQDVLDLLKR